MPKLAHRLLFAIASSVVLPGGSIAVAQIPSVNVNFARGASSTAVAGTITGDQSRDYIVRASAGQTLRVTMSGASIVYFNVLPPGSNDEAIFIGSSEGNSFAGTLSQSGAYKIRVYQMRASARRGQAGNFRLNIAVTGGAGGNRSMPPSASSLRGIAGMDSIAVIDEMTRRGFANVDSLESGNSQYGIFYNRSTHLCAQLTMADGRVLDARDIQTHPKCR